MLYPAVLHKFYVHIVTLIIIMEKIKFTLSDYTWKKENLTAEVAKYCTTILKLFMNL